jgi:hypothetical protein
LRLKPIQPEQALPQVQMKEVQVAPVPVKESPELVQVSPIMINTRGEQLPPGSNSNFNAKKTKIKKSNLSMTPVIKKNKKPINLNKERESVETKYSETKKFLIKSQLNKKIRELKKKIEGKELTTNQEDYFKALLDEINYDRKFKSLNDNIPEMNKILININELEHDILKEKLALQSEKTEENKEFNKKYSKLLSIKGPIRLKSPTIEQLKAELETTESQENRAKLESFIKKLEYNNLKNRFAKLSEKGQFRLKGRTIEQLKAELETTESQKNKDKLTLMIQKLEQNQELNKQKAKELKDKKAQELRNLPKKISNQNVEEQHKNELKRLIDLKKDKDEKERINLEKKLQKNKEPEIILRRKQKEIETKIQSLKGIESQLAKANSSKNEKEQTILRKQSQFLKLSEKEKKYLEEKKQQREKLGKELSKLSKPIKELSEEISTLEKEIQAEKDKPKEIERKRKEIEREVAEDKGRDPDSIKLLEKYSDIFEIQQRLKATKNNSEEFKEIGKERAKLYAKLQGDKDFSVKARKEASDLISQRFKEMSLKQLIEKYSDLFNLISEKITENNKDKKSKLKNKIAELYQQLRDDKDFDKETIKKVLVEFSHFTDQKKLEHNSKKRLENIEKMRKNQIKSLQEKHNAISLEKNIEPIKTKDTVEIRSIAELIKQSKGKNISKNLLKRFLKNSFSSVDEKNKAEFKKVYKKLSTPGIKNSPKTKIKLQELFNKFKKIEENKVKKVNRTTNELATPELPKDTPSFFQKFEQKRFAPKPEISPWAKKATKKSSPIVTNTVKPTFSKDSLGIKKDLLISPPQKNSSPIKKNSNFTRVPYKIEGKIIKLIGKLPSQTIKIKDIKSQISGIQNKETQRQLRSLLDQKLISITRKK